MRANAAIESNTALRLENERERSAPGADRARSRLATTIEALKTVDRRIQWLMDCNDLLKQPERFTVLPSDGSRDKHG